jgi:hypothetical protein
MVAGVPIFDFGRYLIKNILFLLLGCIFLKAMWQIWLLFSLEQAYLKCVLFQVDDFIN